ncbi:AMP-binding protein [Saccharopolyspora flava]|uniref:Acyl-CoA synthetase (AMP-forming)/AMP-acid ligase II n=1 Tax=Saccharopolyspora flava TaxID=95161 RepID=A0A1I6U3V6_9PSEU|nr:AMP-binding protein [Saccharopolyspora flava]SFS96199.1 Acyl-CoA synthetase (AMP-forming)/AMP-acid ligase II [Saccharopolyspora flava]
MDVSFGTWWEAIAERMPEAVALSEPGFERGYGEFEDRAARLAGALAAAGIGAGDAVACYLHNGAAYLEAVFAAFKIGAVPVNVNYRYTRHELTELLADAGAKALVHSAELAGNIVNLPPMRLVVSTDELDELLAASAPRPREPRPGTDTLFMYTGGTTGKPKGVIWRHSALLNSLLVPVFRPLGASELPATLDEAMRLAESTRDRAPRTMPVVPLMHGTGLFNSMGALLVGGRVVTARPGGLDPEHVWRRVAEQRVSTLIVAGNAVGRPLIEELLRAENVGAPHDLTSLRSVISSGMAFSDELKRPLHERAEVTVFDALASSEGGPFAFAVTSSTDDLPSRFFPVPGARVLTADGAEVAPGETGVLAYSGPIPLGYHADETKTAATFRDIDGRRHSIPGDLAQLEPDGAIRFLGRGSGVINTGGEKVHPPEVEEALLAHPDVTDCLVVGLPDEHWGELVAAVVATRSPDLTAADLQTWTRRTLAGHKIPRRIALRPSLPRTPAGKLEIALARELLDNP